MYYINIKTLGNFNFAKNLNYGGSRMEGLRGATTQA